MSTTECADRITENVLPIEFLGWNMDNLGNLTYYNVEFLEKFGKFNKGEVCHTLVVSFQDMVVYEISETTGNRIKEVNIILIPQPEIPIPPIP